MIIYEFKVKVKEIQYRAIDEAIRTSQFIQNKCLRYWMDNKGVSKYDLNKHCTVLAVELFARLRSTFAFADELNSMPRQSAAERAWSAISRFYDNCKKQVPGKKGFPKFKKYCRVERKRANSSTEYKTSGWKLSENRKAITFSDKKEIGKLKLKGTYDLNYYQIDQIKRVRLIRRADGYYCQFALKVDVKINTEPTGKAIGLDVGIKYFLADSNGNTVENPQFYRSSERQLNRANRQKSKKYKKGAKPQSKNHHKARCRYAKKHLRVSRQRKEYCKRVAYSVIHSNDVVAYEDLNVKGMIKNRHLSKSISDVGWSTFRQWLGYFGKKYGKSTIAVSPQNTSQNCSNCGQKVKKSLSTRTHICPHCGYVEDRDINAAKNILQKARRAICSLALSTVGHTGTNTLVGDLPSGLVGEILPSDGESANQESPCMRDRGVSII